MCPAGLHSLRTLSKLQSRPRSSAGRIPEEAQAHLHSEEGRQGPPQLPQGPHAGRKSQRRTGEVGLRSEDQQRDPGADPHGHGRPPPVGPAHDRRIRRVRHPLEHLRGQHGGHDAQDCLADAWISRETVHERSASEPCHQHDAAAEEEAHLDAEGHDFSSSRGILVDVSRDQGLDADGDGFCKLRDRHAQLEAQGVSGGGRGPELCSLSSDHGVGDDLANAARQDQCSGAHVAARCLPDHRGAHGLPRIHRRQSSSQLEEHGQDGNVTSCDRRNGCPGGPKARAGQRPQREAEDEHGVQRDVRRDTDQGPHHGRARVAEAPKDAVHHHQQRRPKRSKGPDPQVASRLGRRGAIRRQTEERDARRRKEQEDASAAWALAASSSPFRPATSDTDVFCSGSLLSLAAVYRALEATPAAARSSAPKRPRNAVSVSDASGSAAMAKSAGTAIRANSRGTDGGGESWESALSSFSTARRHSAARPPASGALSPWVQRRVRSSSAAWRATIDSGAESGGLRQQIWI
eukprot:scaffold141_cov232-Pinguiococcus_pyrenoidosus.AAC.5